MTLVETPLMHILSRSLDLTSVRQGLVSQNVANIDTPGYKAKDIDFWEINEAFSVVALYAIRELGLDPSKVNVHGGAIAIGHPLGASGARLVGTLARELHQNGKEFGVATLCVGGGQGFAILMQRA
jgi:acetyl-CoA C-acetyltransferase